MISILIAESSNLFLSGLAATLGNQPDVNIVCQTDASDRLISDIHNHQPDIVLMDVRLNLDEMVNAISTCTNPHTRFVVVTDESSEPSTINHLLRAGAHGCIQISQGEDFILQSIRGVASSSPSISLETATQLQEHDRNSDAPAIANNITHPQLTHREYLVLSLLYQGLSNKIIGNQLKISERTVEAHVRNIFIKLNASSRTHAVFLASKNGWFRNDS
jgi:two-component system, NarL family, response regulator